MVNPGVHSHHHVHMHTYYINIYIENYIHIYIEHVKQVHLPVPSSTQVVHL